MKILNQTDLWVMLGDGFRDLKTVTRLTDLWVTFFGDVFRDLKTVGVLQIDSKYQNTEHLETFKDNETTGKLIRF